MQRTPLKLLIEAMLIVSGVDGIHPKEQLLISTVLNKMWQDSPEQLAAFFQEARMEVAGYSEQGSLDEKFKETAIDLSKYLKSEEKLIVLELMKGLIASDQHITHREMELYTQFKNVMECS